MTEITQKGNHDLRDIFISIAYQKDLNLINTTIFMIVSGFLGFGLKALYCLYKAENAEQYIYLTGGFFVAFFIAVFIKALYLTYSSTANNAQNFKTTTLWKKITTS